GPATRVHAVHCRMDRNLTTTAKKKPRTLSGRGSLASCRVVFDHATPRLAPGYHLRAHRLPEWPHRTCGQDRSGEDTEVYRRGSLRGKTHVLHPSRTTALSGVQIQRVVFPRLYLKRLNMTKLSRRSNSPYYTTC